MTKAELKELGYEQFHTYNYDKGFQIPAREIVDWHNEALQRLIENPEAQFTYQASGNSMVVAKRDFEDNTIKVYEFTSGYTEYEYRPVIKLEPAP